MTSIQSEFHNTDSSQIVFGGIAGAFSALAFTILHDFMISSIWFMLIPMLIAGAMSGAAISWSYNLLVLHPNARSWVRYNLIMVILLYLMTPISLWLYEPVITIPELISSPDGLPDNLVKIITPFAMLYTLAMAAIITFLHGRRWEYIYAALLTSTILMFLLGLNIAPFGLVYLSSGWQRLMLEQIGLIMALNIVFALGYWWLASLRYFVKNSKF